MLFQDPRVTVYVDVGSESGTTNYFRWTLRGTYQVWVTDVEEGLKTCYRPLVHHSPGQVDSDDLGGGSIFRRSAGTLPMSGHALMFRLGFHIVAEQQALTPEAYNYWSRIHNLRYNVGSLFDPPAEATFGNVANILDPEDRALGYFTVGAMATADTCVNMHDFEDFPPIPQPMIQQGTCGGSLPGSLVPPPEFVQACRR